MSERSFRTIEQKNRSYGIGQSDDGVGASSVTWQMHAFKIETSARVL